MTSLSSSAAALAQTYTYDSFGKLTASTGTLTNPFRYTGREFDPETGIYEYRARYLDQNLGRFVSEDPAGFLAGNNFYTYVTNRPTRFNDPFGESAQDVQNIINNFNNLVNSLTSQQLRHPFPEWNNFDATINIVTGGRRGHRYLGCGEQTDRVIIDARSRHYDDHWTFTMEQMIFPFPHQWAVAVSDNPTDPVVILDPWNGATGAFSLPIPDIHPIK